MKQYVIPAIRLTAVCIVVFCGFYSLLILGLAQAAPGKGLGETVSVKGQVVGYALEGQAFASDRYFQSRPSAAGYNAAGSAGSNKGPTNPDYLKDVQNKIDTFIAHNPGVRKDQVPSELVTYSGGGLDPDLSPAGAMIQVPRIATARGMAEGAVKELVRQNIQGPLFGLLGPAKVNVLKLNIALDAR